MASVLIVDDEEGMCRTLGLFLSAAGHKVRTASTAAEASGALATTEFDVVVSDIVMPGEGGMELLRAVRERSPLTQFILITGIPSVDTATAALRLGAFDYVPKPVTRDMICRVVDKAAMVRDLKVRNERLNQENRRQRDELQRLVEERTAELRRALDRLGSTLASTTRALSAALEKRDPYTAGHQRRVADLACAIWDRLGFDREARNGLRIAALLHDIGKIEVPAEILSKPSRLSPAEFAIVQDHPAAGAEILAPVAFPWPVASIVRQHHERVDGSGYPVGLKGDAILREAQVLAVADVVEAMSSHRPYRPALGLDEALEEVRKGRGTRFWPDAVDAAMALFIEDGFALPE